MAEWVRRTSDTKPNRSYHVSAKLGPKPTMLYYLTRTPQDHYVVNIKLPVTADYQAAEEKLRYAQLDVEAREAITELVWRANGHNPDLTNHLWALLCAFKASMENSLAVTLQWQPAEASPPPLLGTTPHIPPRTSSGVSASLGIDETLFETTSNT
jgi:hypothetical protein